MLFAATLIWGGSFVVLKNAIGFMPPFFTLAMRGTIAVASLSVIFWRHFRNMKLSYIWEGAILGLVLILAFGLQTEGLALTTPGKNAFLTSVYCVMVPFIYWIFTKIRPDRYNILAAILCIAGIGLVALREESVLAGGSLVGAGDILTLFSGIFYAAHIVAVAKFAPGKDVILLNVIQFVFFSLAAWIISFFFETPPASVGGDQWMRLLYLGVFASGIAMLMQTFGQKYTPASQAAIILSLEGVLGVVFSILFFHEQMTPRLLAGFGLIFISVLISETKLNVHPVAYLQDVYARIIEKKANSK